MREIYNTITAKITCVDLQLTANVAEIKSMKTDLPNHRLYRAYLPSGLKENMDEFIRVVVNTWSPPCSLRAVTVTL